MKNPVDAFFKKFFDDLLKRRERARIEAAITQIHTWLGRAICDDRGDASDAIEISLEEIAMYRERLRLLDATG